MIRSRWDTDRSWWEYGQITAVFGWEYLSIASLPSGDPNDKITVEPAQIMVGALREIMVRTGTDHGGNMDRSWWEYLSIASLPSGDPAKIA